MIRVSSRRQDQSEPSCPGAWIPERSATSLREADLNVLSKLGNQGLEWRLEPEAFTRREVRREDDLLDILVPWVGCLALRGRPASPGLKSAPRAPSKFLLSETPWSLSAAYWERCPSPSTGPPRTAGSRSSPTIRSSRHSATRQTLGRVDPSFETFCRVDSGRANLGSGLGLSLVAAIGELYVFARVASDNRA